MMLECHWSLQGRLHWKDWQGHNSLSISHHDTFEGDSIIQLKQRGNYYCSMLEGIALKGLGSTYFSLDTSDL